MSRLRQALHHLGKSGIAFLIALVLGFLLYFTGPGGLLVLDIFVLIPLSAIVAFRALRYIKHHSLWSLRNRLLVVYGLIGVLPILLLFVLVGLGAWALMNELANYLAGSALDRRLEAVSSAVSTLRRIPENQRANAAPQIAKAFSNMFPGIAFYVKDPTRDHRYPPNARHPPSKCRPDGRMSTACSSCHFYVWDHFVDEHEEITALAPLSNEIIENLVPQLGAISSELRELVRPI